MPDAQPAPLHPPGARKKKWKWRWLVLALVVLFIAIFFGVRRGGNSPSKAAPPPPPVAISTATVTKGDIGVYVNALGTVTPINTVSITSRVLGSITSVNYREGQKVHKGDLLLQIDPRPYQAQLTQNQGQLARDQALLVGARVNLDRYQAALERNAIAQQHIEIYEALIARSTTALRPTQTNSVGTMRSSK